jgi:hypothetical protein
VSIISALVLAFHLISANTLKSFFVNIFVALATLAASMYIGENWGGKNKIPGVTNYNDAVQSTKTVRGQLALLSLTWGATAVVELWAIMFGLVSKK